MLDDAGINFLVWLECRYWSELELGERVFYNDSWWVVVACLGDGRYTIRNSASMWTRANVDRSDVVVRFGESS